MSEHTHGHSHDHSHTHPHTHDHTHPHTHEHTDTAEAMAVLTYMLDHNRHHAEEVHALAHDAQPEEAAELLHEAVDLFREANNKLEQALQLMK